MDDRAGTRGRARRVVTPVTVFLAVSVAMVPLTLAGPSSGQAAAAPPVTVSALQEISSPCPGENAEVAEAVDPNAPQYVYEAWTGCGGGIGYTRSTDGGASFAPAVQLPGSADSDGDPAMAVGPDGTLYIVFMAPGDDNYPILVTSFDHGATFPQDTPILPPVSDNWGDSPNIAVAPDGDVYVTWDYGPSNDDVVLHCADHGSCAFLKGDLNVVLQVSTDQGATFGPMIDISPGFPWSGADNAPIVIGPDGQLDVLYQEYPTDPTTHDLSAATNYFTASDDGGTTWSTPVPVGASVGQMSLIEWWNEPSLGIDAAGNLYAAWDTQKSADDHADTGWLSYSEDGGATWSTPLQAPTETKKVPHITQVVGDTAGSALVAWLSDNTPPGYSFYVRPFSIASGWLSAPVRVSTSYGARNIWPGDTFGLAALDADDYVAAWGGGVVGTTDQSVVDAAVVTVK